MALHFPAPHLIKQATPGAWELLHGRARDAAVDTSSRRGMLPGMQLREDLLVQLHEMEHVHRSSLPGCDAETWSKRGAWWLEWRKMVEEVAVECAAAARGIAITQARDHFEWAGMPQPSSREERGMMYLQLGNSVADTRNAELCKYWNDLLAHMPLEDASWCLSAVGQIQADYSPANCDVVADWLARKVFPPPPPPKPDKPTMETEEAYRARSKAASEQTKAERRAEQAERASSDANQTAEHLNRDASEYVKRLGADGGSGPIENMRLDVHKHTGARMRPAMCGRTWRPTDVGSTVRYPMNYPSGAVFARRSRGGSILMDWSGSMAWDWEELKAAMRAVPALWVAGYSQHSCSPYSGRYVGRLCILAEGGRLGTWESEPEHTGGNGGSDPAALAYMLDCQQASRPYIWVSDGLVGRDYSDPTDTICCKGGVVRVASLTDAIDMLLGRRVEQYQGTPYASLRY